ncbi:MAG: helix-hairpin-helix domain-containing protein, partial [Eubacteriales bacterium]|nr:helix-hairpin-helix domain-containing protein [Eubacteriales bacterium]
LPSDLSDEEALTELLRQFRGGRVQLLMPQRGAKKQLLDMARFNAGESLQRHTLMGGSGQTALQASLKLLAEKAAADRALHRIEAYDISNIGRDDMVGSMIVFAEGRPARQQYRHYKIKLQDVQDDYQAMREMLQRRLSRIGDDKFGSRPDLILVDGGQGHVNMAVQLIAQMELNIPVAGMVKDNRHRTRGLALPGGHVVELADKLRLHRSIIKSDKSADKNAGKIARKTAEVTARNISKQSDIEYTAEDEMLWRVAEQAADFDQNVSDQQAAAMGLLRLLTAIQDEAHRFAITYQRKLSSKRHTKFSLESINGIGPAKRRLLLHHFGTIKLVGEASLEELEKVQGLGVQAARAVFEHFHGEVGE